MSSIVLIRRLSAVYIDDIKLHIYIQFASDCSRIAWFHRLISDNCESLSINVWFPMSAIRIPHLVHNYSIQILPRPNVVTAVKDLSVLFDAKLTFNVHINKIVVKALAPSNLIIKCFLYRDPETLLQVFTTYERPIFEYVSCVVSFLSYL